MPASFHLRLTWADGSTESMFRTAEVWRNGETTCTMEHPGRHPVVVAELPAPTLFDANTADNTWKVNTVDKED